MQELGIGRLSEPLTQRSWDEAATTAEVAARVEHYGALGPGGGDRVFVGFGNRLEFFADLLAVWRLGGCVVPVDPRLTVFEIEALAAAARPRLFLHAGELDAALAAALGRLEVGPVESGGLAGSSPPSLPPEAAECLRFGLPSGRSAGGTPENPAAQQHTGRAEVTDDVQG